MKVSNETKVGALTAISITLLILGFNYLKGKNLFSKAKTEIYAEFGQVDGLSVASPVTINGLQIGKVYEMHEKDRALSGIIVTINLTKDIDIPKNSFASINKDLLGNSTVTITLGDSKEFIHNGDVLLSQSIPSLMDQVKSSVNPTLAVVNSAVTSLDSLLKVIGTYFDPYTKQNFHTIVLNMSKASEDLAKLMDAKNGALAQSLNNVSQITGNLAKNNDKINQSLDHVEKLTSNLAALKLDETINSLQAAMNELKIAVAKANSKDGSLGLLLNDPKLYRNLESTTYKLNILLDDFRTHPKRYVNVSVFGKKDKDQPLTAPLKDDSASQKK
ncbi:MAG TPA: MlaD family protein [Chitinophagaceae bacterium]|jgi:phospholipid/cholesterol/gamma-HCH transport system substrate-binding protein